VVLQLELSVLQLTLYEDTSQLLDSDIAALMECVTVNIIWKILQSMWTVVLHLELSVLQ
jgi:uncharacterized membrane protein YccF (DUF307 family)